MENYGSISVVVLHTGSTYIPVCMVFVSGFISFHLLLISRTGKRVGKMIKRFFLITDWKFSGAIIYRRSFKSQLHLFLIIFLVLSSGKLYILFCIWMLSGKFFLRRNCLLLDVLKTQRIYFPFNYLDSIAQFL